MTVYAGGVPGSPAGRWLAFLCPAFVNRPSSLPVDQILDATPVRMAAGLPLSRGTLLALAPTMSKGFDGAAKIWTAILVALPAVTGACAPEVLAMGVPNPVTGANATGAMQAYEVPPYREDHRYEVTLAEWTPVSLAFHVRFVNADRCGLPSSYSLDLIDDGGRHYPFHQTGLIHETTATGHLGATIHDSAIDGSVPVPINANTRFVVLQIRPMTGRDCNAVDFRWDFQAQQSPIAFRHTPKSGERSWQAT
jgi:hypothetical protein